MENLILIGTVIAITVVLMVVFGSSKKSKETKVIDSTRMYVAEKLDESLLASKTAKLELMTEFDELLRESGMDETSLTATSKLMRSL